MAIKIEKKIVGYSVVDQDKAANEKAANANVVQLGEPLGRPDQITGSTYKVKTPVTEHALYITINDIVMNEGTPQEHRRPFEIFINSKNMEHFQWITSEESRNLDGPAKAAAGEELADVICYALAIANELELDISTTLLKKMEKNREKYPVKDFRGRFGNNDPNPVSH